MKVLFKREDGTFVIERGGLPYHVLQNDPLFAEAQVQGEFVGFEPAPAQLSQGALARNARAQRNTLLQQSDWTQVADAPVDQTAWATYRQALRDVTTQEGFPEAVVWPVAPN
jgi:hypothetical protein